MIPQHARGWLGALLVALALLPPPSVAVGSPSAMPPRMGVGARRLRRLEGGAGPRRGLTGEVDGNDSDYDSDLIASPGAANTAAQALTGTYLGSPWNGGVDGGKYGPYTGPQLTPTPKAPPGFYPGKLAAPPWVDPKFYPPKSSGLYHLRTIYIPSGKRKNKKAKNSTKVVEDPDTHEEYEVVYEYVDSEEVVDVTNPDTHEEYEIIYEYSDSDSEEVIQVYESDVGGAEVASVASSVVFSGSGPGLYLFTICLMGSGAVLFLTVRRRLNKSVADSPHILEEIERLAPSPPGEEATAAGGYGSTTTAV